jgi:hypothetical protein
VKRLTFIMGGIILVLLLAGAAFMAARLWSSEEQVTGFGGMIPVGGGHTKAGQLVGKGAAKAVKIDIAAAPELPKTPEEVNGVFVRREDNSFFVGTGNMKISMTMEQNRGSAVNADYDGPVIEVVVTRDTTIYKDETPTFFSKAEASRETMLQQVVRRVDSPDEMSENTMIRVWGERRGDRVVAEVLVYQSF